MSPLIDGRNEIYEALKTHTKKGYLSVNFIDGRIKKAIILEYNRGELKIAIPYRNADAIDLIDVPLAFLIGTVAPGKGFTLGRYHGETDLFEQLDEQRSFCRTTYYPDDGHPRLEYTNLLKRIQKIKRKERENLASSN